MMKKCIVRYFLVFVCVVLFVNCAEVTHENFASTIVRTDSVESQNYKRDTIKDDKIVVFQMIGEIAASTYLDPFHFKRNGNEVDSICKPYGFTVKRVAGGVITGELSQEVKRNNWEAARIMQTKYGNNWREKFEKETNYKLDGGNFPFWKSTTNIKE